MSSRTFTRVKISSSICILIAGITLVSAHAEEWKVDFSRRVKGAAVKELSEAPTEAPAEKSFIGSLFDSAEPLQEVVILNTEKGFIPATVRVRQGGNYKIHVVNVNDREKNVSFVLDSFSEHHATYFGKIRTFEIRPKRNGVFRFVSPETSAQGRLVVYPAGEQEPRESISIRQPAAE